MQGWRQHCSGAAPGRELCLLLPRSLPSLLRACKCSAHVGCPGELPLPGRPWALWPDVLCPQGHARRKFLKFGPGMNLDGLAAQVQRCRILLDCTCGLPRPLLLPPPPRVWVWVLGLCSLGVWAWFGSLVLGFSVVGVGGLCSVRLVVGLFRGGCWGPPPPPSSPLPPLFPVLALGRAFARVV